MGIDVRHFCRTMYGWDNDYHRKLVAEHVALIRAVLADEAVKASEPQPQQTRTTTVSYERFTDRARKVMQIANQEAQRFNHEYIGTEHIALGLVKEHSGVAKMVLNQAGIDVRKVRLEVERLVTSGPKIIATGRLPYTPRTKQVLEFAIEESQSLGHGYVGTEHILLGLLREPDGIGGMVIRSLGLSLEEARRAIKDVLGEQRDADSVPAASEPELDEPAERAEGVPAEDAPEWLVKYEGSELDEADIRHLWVDIQAEIARRVQEATATANEVSRNNMETIVKLGWESMSLQKKVDELTADRNAARQQLSEARAEIERLNNTVVGKLIADAIQKDRESDERECRREIRRLRAEVDRLKARQLPEGWEMPGALGNDKQRIAELEVEIARRTAEIEARLERVQQQCNSLPTITLERDAARYQHRVARKYIDELLSEKNRLVGEVEQLQGEECIANKKQKQRIAELESRVAEQAKEIERLSRPVDDVEWARAYVLISPTAGMCYSRHTVNQMLQRERNAREAAETAAAELREAWRWSLYSSNAVVLHENLDAVLAAYRKQKEPTQ